MINFKNWFFREADEISGVKSYKKQNPKNPNQYFVVLYGNTFSIKDELKNLGFRYFQGTWSTLEDKLTDEVKSKLISLGVDLSGLSSQVPNVDTNTNTNQASPSIASGTDQMLQNMKSTLDNLLKNEPDAKMTNLIDQIDKIIERVAASTDEAAKSELVKNFLSFSSKFYNYSFGNQMLIWAQTSGKAEYVASAKRWTALGRTVSDWSKGILIFAPTTVKKKSEDDLEEKTFVTRFKSAKVYDVSATSPIPGHPSPFQPVSRKDWSIDKNEDVEELNVLINSLVEFIKSKNINLDYEELSDEMGGYSAGGFIKINNKFKGINLFSTMVHEAAHELLHWLEKKRADKESSSRQLEIDAETTAYIVCHYFGFETQDSPNYLALWRAKGADIKERKNNIQKAAKEIIQGIENKVQETEIDFDATESYSFLNFLKKKNYTLI
jgi:hypothetical protein